MNIYKFAQVILSLVSLLLMYYIMQLSDITNQWAEKSKLKCKVQTSELQGT